MAIELWAGIECTVNRVGDAYFDQLLRNGHERRIEDLDRFAELGITAIRYPVFVGADGALRIIARLMGVGGSRACTG